MKYNVKPSNKKKFCYDVHIFNIERKVLQKNIEKYRNTPLKKFKLDTIYLLATVYPEGFYYWFYFVIIPSGSNYIVGIMPLYHDFDGLYQDFDYKPENKSKYVEFRRHHIDRFNTGSYFRNLDYKSLFESLKYLHASKGSETVIFPLHPLQEFLFMNWKENPFEVKQ